MKGFALWKNNHSKLISALSIRMIFTCICGCLLFLCVAIRLASLMVLSQKQHTYNRYKQSEIIRKADIIDRNGELLATSIITSSCYVDPSVVIDTKDTVKKLSKIRGMPSIDKIKYKLKDKSKHFVWLMRHVHPTVQKQIMDLGIPGINFQKDYKRIYIHGPLFSHVLGCTDIDCNGICGIEKYFNDLLVIDDKTSTRKLVLSLDLRLQSIVREELQNSMEHFNADGGNVIIMDVNGEILSMVSLPDFDPNNLKESSNDAMFNKNTLGVFEQGSILKILNIAIALDSGSATLSSRFDASAPIRVGRFSIKDFKGKGRLLTTAEAFVFSSNIACAKMAEQFGKSLQIKYFKQFGMFDKPHLEIPEVGSAIIPTNWSDVTCKTVAYGYGIAVSPLHVLSVITSIINDGHKIQPTLLYGMSDRLNDTNELVVSKKTSAIVRDLMRAVVLYGTAKKAGIEGIEIFGKTGTAYKRVGKKGYGSEANRARLTTFIGGFPKDNPQYMLLVTLDNPKPSKETYGYATAGWNVTTTAHNIFQRIIPLIYEGTSKTQSDLQVTKYIMFK